MVLGLILVSACPLPALAQTPEPAPADQAPRVIPIKPPQPTAPAAPKLPPVTADPTQSAANYGDWTLRCQRNAENAKYCEAATIIRAGDPQHTPIAELVFGRISKAEP